jgi:peptide deformylase
MILPILRHGAPVLEQPAAAVLAMGPAVDRLIDDLIETMHAAPGVGLAAPQVGVSQRIFVIDLSVGARPSELVVLVNPRVAEREGLQLEDEGCLSIPGLTATVPRPSRMVVRGWDRRGVEYGVEGAGLLARALQHELDHLDGRLYVHRLPRLRRTLVLRRIDALRSRASW